MTLMRCACNAELDLQKAEFEKIKRKELQNMINNFIKFICLNII